MTVRVAGAGREGCARSEGATAATVSAVPVPSRNCRRETLRVRMRPPPGARLSKPSRLLVTALRAERLSDSGRFFRRRSRPTRSVFTFLGHAPNRDARIILTAPLKESPYMHIDRAFLTELRRIVGDRSVLDDALQLLT